MLDQSDVQLAVDETFLTLSDFHNWINTSGLYSKAIVDSLAQKILSNGFVEPLTERIVTSSEITPSTGNWRETIVANRLNCRQRAVLHLIAELWGKRSVHGFRIYAPEAVTPFAMILRGRFPKFLGSEYTSDAELRKDMFPVPFQDLTQLTLPDDIFDVVSTNEVLEHVPDIDTCLREICRVLKPNGWHVGTHPFHLSRDSGEVRAILAENKIIHLMPAEFHSNPFNAEGSLVFEVPGWDIIARAVRAGFRTAHMRFIASERNGVLASSLGVFVLCCQK